MYLAPDKISAGLIDSINFYYCRFIVSIVGSIGSN